MLVKKAYVKPAVFAAMIFALAQSWEIMDRPDTIYIPVVFEVLYFVVGFVVLVVINAVLIIPLYSLVVLWSQSLIIGTLLSAGMAVSACFAFFGDDLLHQPKVFFGVFLPLFCLAISSFVIMRRAKNSA